MTQAQIIKLQLSKTDEWIPAFKLRSVNTSDGWIGHQGDRVCRKLAENGEIQRKLVGKYVYYHSNQPVKKKETSSSIHCSVCGNKYEYTKDFLNNKVIVWCKTCA
jgi:hypothetical protein